MFRYPLYKTIVIMLICSLAKSGYGQIKSLSIGDTLPDMLITNVINADGPIRLDKAVAPKLIILDFWSTWCSVCIGSFPKLDSLQHQFRDQLLILPVTTEDSSKIIDFWNRSPYTKSLTLPTVVSDTLFRQYFPRQGLPHVAWLDSNLTVKAITSGDYVRAEKIVEMLEGQNVNWVNKGDVLQFDPTTPALPVMQGVKRIGGLQYKAFSGALQGGDIKYVLQRDTISETIRITFVNAPIINMYTWMSTRLLGHALPHNRIKVITETPIKFYFDGRAIYDEWLLNNSYCFESVLPMGLSDEEAYEIAFQDLNGFLKLNARIAEELVPCYEIMRDSTQKQARVERLAGQKKSAYSLRNIAQMLNANRENPPIFADDAIADEELFTDLRYSELQNIEVMRAEIQHAGYTFRSIEKWVKFLIIKDK